LFSLIGFFSLFLSLVLTFSHFRVFFEEYGVYFAIELKYVWEMLLMINNI